MKFLNILSPTLDFNPGALSKIPTQYDLSWVSIIEKKLKKI